MKARTPAHDEAGFTVVIIGVIIAAVGATMIVALRHHAGPGRTLGPSNDANLLSSYFTADVQSASLSDTAAGAASGCAYSPPAGTANVVALSWTDNAPVVPVSRAVAYRFDATAPTLATVAHHVVGATATVDTTDGAIDLDVTARAADAAPSDRPFAFRLRAYGRLSGSGNGGGGTSSGSGQLGAGEVVGTVTKYTDQAGTAGASPLGGLTVTLSRGGNQVATTRTDAAGKYYFGTLDADVYVVELTAPGMAATDGSTLSGPTTVLADQTVHRNFNVWTPTGTVNGVARLTAGSPVSNVSVSITPTSGAPIPPTTTNAAGQFSFSGLPLGGYTVTFTKPGYTVVSGGTCAAAVVDTTPVVCDAVFEVNNATINGTVNRSVALNGTTAMAGVTVTAKLGTTVIDSKTTDASGAFTFSGLAPGTYSVTETLDGFTAVGSATATVTVAAGESKTAAFVNQVCALWSPPASNTISIKNNGSPNPNQKLTVRTSGACAGPVTVQFAAGAPGPTAPLTLTVGSPTGASPTVYTTANIPTGTTWSTGVVTATVKSGGTVVGTIQVTLS
jgi:hypothetical protein